MEQIRRRQIGVSEIFKNMRKKYLKEISDHKILLESLEMAAELMVTKRQNKAFRHINFKLVILYAYQIHTKSP